MLVVIRTAEGMPMMNVSAMLVECMNITTYAPVGLEAHQTQQMQHGVEEFKWLGGHQRTK